jgi:cytochrome c oxidase assembly protein subunit 11
MKPPENETLHNPPKSNKSLTIILSCVALAMFGFGYALVPLYNVLCENLGINGKVNNVADSPVSSVDLTRTITVQFLATNNANLPWQFRPNQPRIDVHPGQNTRVSFYAKNESDHTMTVQAIPSISPGLAVKYLKKTECFCFKQQTFASHASMNMPILFHLDRDIPKDINTVTISYTLFDNTHMKKRGLSDEVVEGYLHSQ